MLDTRKNTILKSTTALIFAGLLVLPVYLEKASDQKGLKGSDASISSSVKLFGFYFEEVSKQSEIIFTHQSPLLDPEFAPILPQIASMGASVSVSDFDNDGWNDLYVTNSRYGSKNALFHNQKDGHFVDVANRMGMADINTQGTGVSMGAIWADYNNDGFEDLFVYKWGRPVLFRNESGKGFTNITEVSGLPGWINANSAIWLDYNSDGLIDLFIGGYFPENVDLWDLEHTNVLTESFEYAQNGGRNYLMENSGQGYFVDVTSKLGLTSTRWTLAAGAADLDLDGFPELIIANDYGKDEIYFNAEGKHFIEMGTETSIGFSPKSGMNVSFGDANNTGNFGIYISNITEDGILLQGNNFWIPNYENNNIVYQNIARQTGIENGGWSYGAQFCDLNNDGFQDLFVANGFISSTKGTNYWYDYAKVTGGNSKIISDIKNWPAMNNRSHSGYQQNKIWMNTGKGFFYDVAGYIVKEQTFDSRAVAIADLWNRGVLDVIVANQNDDLLVYKNYVSEQNHWIAFKLTGTKSNRSAIGTIIRLFWDTQTQSQLVSGGIGFSSQNQRSLHFGIGNTSRVDSALIFWPSGKRQIMTEPQINKVHRIMEGI